MNQVEQPTINLLLLTAVGGFIEIYEDTEPLERINTSNSVYHIIPIAGTTKFVAFNKLNSHKSSFFIHNTETGETFESDEIDGSIGDMIYNPNYNYGNEILVAVNSNPGKVSRYNLAGQYLTDITFPSSDLEYNFMRKMFINPNGKLFITSNMNKSLQDIDPRLWVFNASDYSFIKEHPIEMPSYSYNFYFYNADFCYNKLNGLTYMIISPGQRYEGGGGTAPEFGTPDPYQSTTNYLKDPNYTGNNNGWLIKYDETTNTTENLQTFTFPKEVLFVNTNLSGPSEDQGVLFINADRVYQYDCASEELTSFGISMYKIIYNSIYPNRIFGINDEHVTNTSDRRVLTHEIYFDGTSSQKYSIAGQAGYIFLKSIQWVIIRVSKD
ncbi:MAG: hypothetical protein U5Q03_05625 [Bacteroidota bacterium]|nr:hypothetical protein [Bacteroidota bacterium]